MNGEIVIAASTDSGPPSFLPFFLPSLGTSYSLYFTMSAPTGPAGQVEPRAGRAQRADAAAHHAGVDQVRAEPLRRLRDAPLARRRTLLPRLLHPGKEEEDS